MPIEIRELIIRARVSEHSHQQEKAGEHVGQNTRPTVLSQEERQLIIEECLDRLLKELEARQQW